jgi:hypothetical protein
VPFLENSSEFPKNFRGIVTRYLQDKYGNKISIRSAIIHPPTQGGVHVADGKEVVSFVGKVRFNVLDRRDKDFGLHRMKYVIQDNEIISMEEDHGDADETG